MASSLKFKVPGFAYPGGKVRLRKWLISMMPRSGGTYVEPFAGRGNVFWYAACCLKFKNWWLNDLWTARWFDVINTIDISSIPIRISPKDSISWVKRAYKDRDADDLAVAMESITMFSGGVASHGSSPQRISKYSSEGFKQNLRNARRVIKKTNLTITAIDWNKMGLDVLSKSDFVYLDPPYVDNDADYAVDTVDHTELLTFLKSAHFSWLLSGYDSELYQSIIGPPYKTRSCRLSMCHGGSDRAKQKKRTECVWRNY